MSNSDLPDDLAQWLQSDPSPPAESPPSAPLDEDLTSLVDQSAEPLLPLEDEPTVAGAAAEPLPPIDENTLALGDSGVPLVAVEEETEAAWQESRTGDLASAYRRLAALADLGADDEDLCLRLYWILALWAQLDSHRSKTDWLALGLGSGRAAPRLVELYQRQLSRDPEEAISDRCGRLLGRSVRASYAVELARPRWRAALRQGRYLVIANDLEPLRARVPQEDAGAWLRLLMAAADHLAWADPRPAWDLFQSYVAELRPHRDRHPEMSDDFGRLDFLEQLAGQWRQWRAAAQGRAQQQAAAELAARSWYEPFETIRPALLEWLAPLVDSPEAGLAELDFLHANAKCVLKHLDWLVARLQTEPGSGQPQRPPEELWFRLAAFLRGSDWSHPGQLRPSLVRFCVEESVTVPQVAETILADPQDEALYDATLGSRLLEDAPLECLCKAAQVFAA